jgi:hypothetical protein
MGLLSASPEPMQPSPETDAPAAPGSGVIGGVGRPVVSP